MNITYRLDKCMPSKKYMMNKINKLNIVINNNIMINNHILYNFQGIERIALCKFLFFFIKKNKNLKCIYYRLIKPICKHAGKRSYLINKNFNLINLHKEQIHKKINYFNQYQLIFLIFYYIFFDLKIIII